MEPKNLEATKLKILQLVCRGSQYEEAAVSLRRFFAELERAEPKVFKVRNNVISAKNKNWQANNIKSLTYSFSISDYVILTIGSLM